MKIVSRGTWFEKSLSLKTCMIKIKFKSVFYPILQINLENQQGLFKSSITLIRRTDGPKKISS